MPPSSNGLLHPTQDLTPIEVHPLQRTNTISALNNFVHSKNLLASLRLQACNFSSLASVFRKTRQKRPISSSQPTDQIRNNMKEVAMPGITNLQDDLDMASYSDSAPETSPECSDASTVPTPVCSSPDDLNATLVKYFLTEAMLPIIRDQLVAIAHEAGRMMIDADPSVDTSDTKKNSSDRVTETDKAVEAIVQSQLAAAYPKFAFLGEETFKHGNNLTDAPTFVCDPIDGTLNFIHGFPNTATSLALCVEKKPVVGVIYNPFRGDLFTAIKNQGAYLTTANGITRRLPLYPIPAPMTSLNDCLVAVEWGSQRQGPNWDLRTSIAQTLMTSKASGGAMVHSIRSNGSAALDFCYVAAGWIDCFWEGGVWIWDVCAGWIILEEAGGMVASANPGDWNPTLEGHLYFAVRAAKRAEQEGVVKELWGLMGDRKFVF